MSEKSAPQSYPIESEWLSCDSLYVEMRNQALDDLIAHKKQKCVEAILNYEKTYDTLRQQATQDALREMAWVQASEVLKESDNVITGGYPLREAVGLNLYRWYARFCAEIKEPKGSLICMGDLFGTKPLRLGKDGLLLGNLILMPLKIYQFSRFLWGVEGLVSTAIQMQKEAPDLVNILKGAGVLVREINYLNIWNLPREIPIQSGFKVMTETIELAITSQHLCSTKSLEIKKGFLKTVFSKIASWGDACAVLRINDNKFTEISPIKILGRSVDEHLEEHVGIAAEWFLENIPQTKSKLFERIALRTVTLSGLPDNRRVGPIDHSIFFKEDINYEVLAHSLPYLIFVGGEVALSNIEPGDEFDAVPHFRKILSRSFKTRGLWERISRQPKQTTDSLLRLDGGDPFVNESLLLTLSAIPRGYFCSPIEAYGIEKNQVLCDHLRVLDLEVDRDSLASCWKKCEQTAQANKEKAASLLLDNARDLAKSEDTHERVLKLLTGNEANDVMDYVEAKFISMKGRSKIPKLRAKSFTELSKASEKWHKEIAEMEFEGEDVRFHPPQGEYETDQITLSFAETKKELHTLGATMRNCVYSMLDSVLRGRCAIIKGRLKGKGNGGERFLARVELSGDDKGIRIIQLRGFANADFDYQKEELIRDQIMTLIRALPPISKDIVENESFLRPMDLVKSMDNRALGD